MSSEARLKKLRSAKRRMPKSGAGLRVPTQVGMRA